MCYHIRFQRQKDCILHCAKYKMQSCNAFTSDPYFLLILAPIKFFFPIIIIIINTIIYTEQYRFRILMVMRCAVTYDCLLLF